jgi:hypothetical protein
LLVIRPSVEKHYGDARVDAEQLDEMIGEFESPTANLPGTLPDASADPRDGDL